MATEKPVQDVIEHEVVLHFVVDSPVSPVELENRVFDFQRVADEYLEGVVDGPVVAGNFEKSSIEVAFSYAGTTVALHRTVADVVEILERQLVSLQDIRPTTSHTEPREAVWA